MGLISEKDYQAYNVQDITVSVNGLEMRGFTNSDECIKIKYNEQRYSIQETIDNNSIGVMTNSKQGEITFSTNFMTNTAKAMLGLLALKTIALVTISVPNHILITLTGSHPSDIGTISIGKNVNDQEITFLGILNILPLGEAVPEIPGL